MSTLEKVAWLPVIWVGVLCCVIDICASVVCCCCLMLLHDCYMHEWMCVQQLMFVLPLLISTLLLDAHTSAVCACVRFASLSRVVLPMQSTMGCRSAVDLTPVEASLSRAEARCNLSCLFWHVYWWYLYSVHLRFAKPCSEKCKVVQWLQHCISKCVSSAWGDC